MAAGSIAGLPPGFELEQQPTTKTLPPGFEIETPPPAAASAPASTGVGDVVQGIGDAALSGASKLATSVVGAPIALINRLVAAAHGGNPQEAADAAHDFVNEHFGYDTRTPVGKQIGSVVQGALAPVGRSMAADTALLQKGGQALGIPAGEVHGALSELGDIGGTAGIAAPLLGGARASAEAAALAAQNAPAAVTKYGFRTAEDSPIARNVAGSSGREALSGQNQMLGNTVLGAEAGIPHGTDLSYQALENGRAAPNAVYGRAAAALPDAPLSPSAQSAVQSAGGTGQRITEGTPDAIDAINSLKSQLLAPDRTFTGNQVVNELRGLRQEGYVNAGSDDVSKQQLGRAQLDMARGLEQHVADTLPPDADVSLDQLQAARTALAKNHAVQGALRGSDVDMQAIGRIQRADPGLLTGPLADVADFANSNPEVSSLPGAGARYNPPGLARDAASVSLADPRTWAQALSGPLARRILTGSPDAALEAAQTAPVAGAGGTFAPLPRNPGPLALSAPPGRAFEPHQPQLATGAPVQQSFFGTGANELPPQTTPGAGGPTPAGQGGQISLADLLSHGVEQPPPEELTAGPMGAPQAQGIPFSRNAGHEAGPLSLLDDLIGPSAQAAPRQSSASAAPGEPPQHPTLADLLQDLNQHPDVMSQGVPEGVMTRTANNASGESSASLEAINRQRIERAQGNDRFLVDPDGRMWPLPGVEAVDAKAPSGSLIIQKGVGGEPFSILDRGGLPQSHARGLMQRAMAGHGGGLTLADLIGGG